MNPERQFSAASEQLFNRERLVVEVAEALHETWRKHYASNPANQSENGSIKPRLKTTTDTSWIEQNGTAEVDIFHEPFTSLPEDWKFENMASAEVALDLIATALSNNESLDDSFIEKASDIIHEKWLERNGSYAPLHQNMPYAQLDDSEKEADRLVMREALKIVQG